jgi:peptidoglycan hydrolase CwlO-like protein
LDRRRRIEERKHAMASSSGPKPTVEARLTALEEKLENLRGLMTNLDEFLQNLDSEAGRRMEALENDIIYTRSGLSEEIWKLRKELGKPKQDHEERMRNLEQQMEQLNKEWTEEKAQSKGKGKE